MNALARKPELGPALDAVAAEWARRANVKRMKEVERDASAVRARCKTLAGFMREAWPILEPLTTLSWNWHLDAICEHLEAVSRGEINRLLVNVPPGSSKSLIVSVMWHAWEWGPLGRPETRWLSSSFNDGPIQRDMGKVRTLMQSEWYQRLWPHVRLVKQAEFTQSNTRMGERRGVAFGSITSQRGDRFVIDDPHSTTGAESDDVRDKNVRQFREGGFNRLNDQERSAIVVIMQRLHESDLSGAIIKLGGYVHLMIPMELEIERRCSTKIGWVDPRTVDGELMDLQRFPQHVIDQMKVDTTQYAWAGQYQQRPAPREGGLFKRAWFNDTIPALPAGVRGVRGWDLAGSKKDKSPYSAGVAMWVWGKTFLISNVVRLRGSPGEVKGTVLATARSDGLAVGISLPQDPGQAALSQKLDYVQTLSGFNARFSPESGDKEFRARPVSAQAEVGNLKLVRTGDPARDAWIEPFLDEICSFPAGTYADQVDAMSRAFQECLKLVGLGSNIMPGPIQEGAGKLQLERSTYG